MAINAGTRIEFDIVGATGAWVPRTADGVRSSVISRLSQYGTTESLSITKTSSGIPLVHAYTNWGYTARLRFVTKYGHAAIADVNAIVRSAFWDACGEPPTVSAIGFNQAQSSPGTDDQTPSMFGPLLATGSITVVLAIAAAVFVLKRG